MPATPVPSLWRQTLKNPRLVGAVAPSSPALCRAMVQEALPCQGLVVELGPGQGPVTDALLASGLEPSRLLAIEANPVFACALSERLPQISVLPADARDLPQILSQRGERHAGVIVSSLPWRAMPSEVSSSILCAIAQVMNPGCRMVQYTYGWRSPIPSEVTAALGWSTRYVKTVWANLPPARVFVYQA